MRGEKGRPGTSIKGDKGDTGLGLPGPEGLRGEKGDQGLPGVGLPGKMGPRGPVGQSGRYGLRGEPGADGLPGQDGLRGETGEPGTGIKGDKGDTGLGRQGLPGEPGMSGSKGEKGDSGHSRKSAFTAVKTSSQTGNGGDVVSFQETPTNINGHFSLATNKFTCQVPGTYFFTFSMGIHQPGDLNIMLVKNGHLIVSAHTRTGGFDSDFDQTSSSAVLNLEMGDQVWLKFVRDGNTIYSTFNRHSTFSGFLLYEM